MEIEETVTQEEADASSMEDALSYLEGVDSEKENQESEDADDASDAQGSEASGAADEEVSASSDGEQEASEADKAAGGASADAEKRSAADIKAEFERKVAEKRQERLSRQDQSGETGPGMDQLRRYELHLQDQARQLHEQQQALQADPIKFMEARGLNPQQVYDRMTNMAINEQGTRALDRVEQVEQRQKQREEALQGEIRQIREAQARKEREAAHQQARKEFVEFVDENASKYKYLGSINPKSKAEWGAQIAAQMLQADIEFDNEQVAYYTDAIVGEIYEEIYSKLHADGAGKPAGDGSSEEQAKPLSKTISNKTVSETASSGPVDKTEDDYFLDALAEAEKFLG